jgi:ATP-dependent Clp protease ATP-binding subunit ClpC
MFERFTEKARRVIFFARYEASQFGLTYIETEHLLLGLLREDKALTNRFLRSYVSVESIRKEIEKHTTVREKVATNVDIPLSNESKRVLAYAAEESERLGHKHIGTEHLLLGLLREEKCFAAGMLREREVNLDAVRQELAKASQQSVEKAPFADVPSADYFQDLTRAAIDGNLGPIVARDAELEAVIEVLAASQNRNPLLLGERGVGKRAIVEALAQRIADGAVPPFLSEKRVMILDLQSIPALTKDRIQFVNQVNESLIELITASNSILILSELRSAFVRPALFLPSLDAGILKSAIAQGKIQCIAACPPDEYKVVAQAVRWIDDQFRAIHVRPLGEGDSLTVLKARKLQSEKFHEVSFSDEALELATKSSSRYLPVRALPGKAIELLDAAAARVKSNKAALPAEILEVQNRIRFIVHRMDGAIANHEFEKARFYSDEEKKERENLSALSERYKVDDAEESSAVRREDVEAVIARWSEYPYQP